MFPIHNIRSAILVSSMLSAGTVIAEDYLVVPAGVFPGELAVSRGGAEPGTFYRRASGVGGPDSVPAISSIAMSADGRTFFCSGLDRQIRMWIDATHESLIYEAAEQVRDIACTDDPNVILFSMVGTPQNGSRLPDGKILSLNLTNGDLGLVATVMQRDVGGNWWGTFCMNQGAIFISTSERDSRILKKNGDSWMHAGTAVSFRITGLHADANGRFLVTTGSGKIYQTSDFSGFDAVLVTRLNLKDVSTRPASVVAGFRR